MQRVVIVGAGAMGCFFAARLAESGGNVTLIDVDDARLAALASDGITIDDAFGKRTVAISALRAEAASGTADLIILFTKGTHTLAATTSVAHLVGPQTRALTLQNGVGNAEAIATYIEADHIMIGVTDIPCDLNGPTSVSSHGAGHITLGSYSGTDAANAETIAQLLRSAGLNAAHDKTVAIAVWEKIAFNAALNALCTVTGLPVGGLDTEPGQRLIKAMAAEVITVALAKGIQVSTERIKDKIANALANHIHHKPSMLQDRLAGRATEIETINGAVVMLGEALGIDTPVNRTLADLVRAIQVARIT